MIAPSDALLDTACAALAASDTALAEAYREIGRPIWRKADPCYATLARAIAYQQLSTKAAGTIWGRVEALVGVVDPHTLLGHSDEDLRACGMSRPKVRYLKAIAEAVHSDALNFERLCEVPIDEARKELIAVKGIGPWTAEIFLMNAVGKMDAFPPGDVGLMEAYRQLAGHDDRHDAKAFTALAEDWRPYRSVAALLLWGWINKMRDKAYP